VVPVWFLLKVVRVFENGTVWFTGQLRISGFFEHPYQSIIHFFVYLSFGFLYPTYKTGDLLLNISSFQSNSIVSVSLSFAFLYPKLKTRDLSSKL